MLPKLVFSLLLYMLLSHLTSLSIVKGDVTMQCAQTGAGKLFYNQTKYGWHLRTGSFTIGAKRFDSTYGGAINSGFSRNPKSGYIPFEEGPGQPEKQHCNYTINPRTGWYLQLCDEKDERMKIRVNAVQQTDPPSGKLMTLEGWLHIEFELVDKQDSIRIIYVQMYDEYFNAIGEFVKDPTEQCPPSDPEDYVTPTEFQVLPCSAIGAREAKPSQAVYMVHSEDLIDKSLTGSHYLPPKEINRKVHVTWRMNEYWCSRHYRITPMVFVVTKKNLQDWKKTTKNGTLYDETYVLHEKLGWWKLYRKIPNYWLLPGWIGAADIKHPNRGSLQCNNAIWDAPWIRGKFNHTVQQEYKYYLNTRLLHKSPVIIRGSDSCQQNPYYLANYSTFAGRCENHFGKNTSSNYLHKCNTNASSLEFESLNIAFVKYTEYVINLTTARKESCERHCRSPQTVADAIQIASLDATFINRPVIETGYGLTHKSRAKSSINRFWRGRKFHGVVCLIVTMFLMPVSNFLTRYYKEAFMRFQFKGIHVWYWTHVGSSLASVGLLLSGQMAMGHTLESWGRSESSFAIIHHCVGWISIFLHIVMVIYGGFRSSKRKRNKFIMIGHSIIGFGIYGSNGSRFIYYFNSSENSAN
ncbi:unnamed protein product [Orchesella dallaii]|uniref:Ferric-chelate reductase 1 n=1 Tax=Orchesella dallaii TaxID=48710 RepID=A0ABP1S094_9HEXA